jgi:hypothetical protein
MTYLLAIFFPVARRLFGFHSRGMREIAADFDDRVIVGGEKRETILGDERDVIL